MAIEPPMPGAERFHSELRTWLRGEGLLVASLKQVPAGREHLFAQCNLRTDVPAPHVLALECVDGHGAFPLHTARNVFIWQSRSPSFEKNGGSKLMDSFVADQLRNSGLTVVSAADRRSAEESAEDVFTFRFGFRFDAFYFSRCASVALSGSGDRMSRTFEVCERAFVDQSVDIYQRALQKAIDQFLQARLEDAEIYDVRNRLPPQRHSSPRAHLARQLHGLCRLL